MAAQRDQQHIAMTPERWKKLEALFQEAVELQREARVALLAQACGSDELLREQAGGLIAAHEREGSFMDSPIFAEAAALATHDHHESPVGQCIGPYQVISRLGQGGMEEHVLGLRTLPGSGVGSH